MKLYDAIIHETLAAAGGAKRWPASSLVPWPVTENSELVMQRQAAFELGDRKSVV